jgi:hypothetical protein
VYKIVVEILKGKYDLENLEVGESKLINTSEKSEL